MKIEKTSVSATEFASKLFSRSNQIVTSTLQMERIRCPATSESSFFWETAVVPGLNFKSPRNKRTLPVTIQSTQDTINRNKYVNQQS